MVRLFDHNPLHPPSHVWLRGTVVSPSLTMVRPYRAQCPLQRLLEKQAQSMPLGGAFGENGEETQGVLGAGFFPSLSSKLMF